MVVFENADWHRGGALLLPDCSGNNAVNIRNFCIIAHVDHGKSTLADRILELTRAIPEREMTEQVLDRMDLERERGITIKAKAVRLVYVPEGGPGPGDEAGPEGERARGDRPEYVFNLIDTPGHVDFNYEVSRSLAACEGAVLVVDASQGVEAQTIANLYLAIENDLTIIPVINKIDLPNADPERVLQELKDIAGIAPGECIFVSAKTGEGVPQVLQAIADRIPPPRGRLDAPLRALVFDSHFDPYRGVIAYVRVVDGCIRPGMPILLMATGKQFEVSELGVFRPDMQQVESLAAGEVGYVVAGVKNVSDLHVGDTIADARVPGIEPLPGYRQVRPMVFCGLYPVETDKYEALRDALAKLKLNDASLSYEPETSVALGFGFRCGFLGLLHMDIVRERLEREFDLELIVTAPSVVYRVRKTNGQVIWVDNPAELPPAGEIEAIEEPFVRATIVSPADYIGPVMELCEERRGNHRSLEYLSKDRVAIVYDLPLSEILLDFFDKLKSRTRGYASLDYEYTGHMESDLVRLDILLNNKPVDALSCIIHRDKAYERGRQLVERLRKIIPRQLFEVPIQAAVGSRVIARETVSALRKNVLQKCYGGDVTRKRKLLEKQKEGKKRMKQLGTVEVPQEAFMAVLKVD
ncbi:MAG TPA: elongation factor 4 [Firmicutes bacterium]|nr:elongation factor 4 [Bacillota bacterium]